MRTRHIVAVTVAALALAGVPVGALAAKPSHPATPASTNANSHANATTTTTTTRGTNVGSTKVMFVLRGKVTTYTPGSSLGMTLKSVNHQRSILTSGMTVALTLDGNTKVVLHDGAAVAPGDMVVVKVHAAKNAPSSTLSTTAASQLVDQG
jgi:hypothetical protein